MNYKRNIRYFKGMNMLVPLLIGIAGILFAFVEEIRGWGLLMVVVSVLWFVAIKKLMPTDEEIDKITFAFLRNTEEGAIEKLKNSYDDFDLKDPIKINNYSFKPLKGVQPMAKRGKDNRVRSSFYAQSMFMFTDNQIIHRELVFSIIHPAVVTFTEEYYYDDLVTVKSHESDSMPFSPTGSYQNRGQVSLKSFELITKGGNNVTFSFRNQDKVDKVVEHMKMMIRKRKTSGDTGASR